MAPYSFLRDEVAILSEKWISAVSLKKALDILGLNRRVALDLAHAGKIKILRGPLLMDIELGGLTKNQSRLISTRS